MKLDTQLDIHLQSGEGEMGEEEERNGRGRRMGNEKTSGCAYKALCNREFTLQSFTVRVVQQQVFQEETKAIHRIKIKQAIDSDNHRPSAGSQCNKISI